LLKKNDDVNHSAFIDAVASLPDRKLKDGQGRAAEIVAYKFGVSVSTVYHARSILKHGQKELINALRHGDIPVKTIYKKIKKNKENIMNINGYDELAYLKYNDYILKEIKKMEKIINEAGFSSDIKPRFYLENNNISFDVSISFPLSKEKI